MFCRTNYKEIFVEDVPNVSSSNKSTEIDSIKLISDLTVYPEYKTSDSNFSFRDYGLWKDEFLSNLDIKTNSDVNSNEFLDVFITTPLIPTKIEIFETFMPGSLVKISACYHQDDPLTPINTRSIRWRTIWKKTADKTVLKFKSIREINKALNKLLVYNHLCGNKFDIDDSYLTPELKAILRPEARVFQPQLSNVPPIPVDLFRFEFNTKLSLDQYQIDAIRISGFRNKFFEKSSINWVRRILSLPAPTTEEDLNDEKCIIESILPKNYIEFIPEVPLFAKLRRSNSIDSNQSDLPKSELSLLNVELPCSLNPVEYNMNEYLIDRFANLEIPFSPTESSKELSLHWKSVNYFGKSFKDLPYEVNLRIFSYLDLQSLCRAASVSKLFYDLSNDALASQTSIDLKPFWVSVKAKSLISLSFKLNRGLLYERPPNIDYQIKETLKNSRISEWNKRMQETQISKDRNSPEDMTEESDLFGRPLPLESALRLQRKFSNRKRSVSTSFQDDLIRTTQVKKNKREKFYPSLSEQSKFYRKMKSDEYSGQRLRRLNLSWCGSYNKISPMIFSLFLQNACQNLTCLRVSCCLFIDDECLMHIVNHCRKLEELDLSSCTEIKPEGFLILGRLFNLKWLSLYRCNILKEALENLANLSQNLLYIDLGDCLESHQEYSDDSSDVYEWLLTLTRNNANIKSINLSHWKYLNPMAPFIICTNAHQLEEICLDFCEKCDSPGLIRHIAFRCYALKKLSLQNFKCMDESDLLALVESAQDTLEYVDLTRNPVITDEILVSFVAQCKNLIFINVSLCEKITPQRIFDLRSLYPFCFVQCNFPNILMNRNIDPMDEEYSANLLLPSIPQRLALLPF